MRVVDAGPEVEIQVEDTGRGIPAAALPYIFEWYRQAHQDRGGTGLGLAIVRSDVDAHGGRVTVESQEGKGSRFTVLLPRERRGRVRAFVLVLAHRADLARLHARGRPPGSARHAADARWPRPIASRRIGDYPARSRRYDDTSSRYPGRRSRAPRARGARGERGSRAT